MRCAEMHRTVFVFPVEKTVLRLISLLDLVQNESADARECRDGWRIEMVPASFSPPSRSEPITFLLSFSPNSPRLPTKLCGLMQAALILEAVPLSHSDAVLGRGEGSDL